MRRINFPDWPVALASEHLPEHQKRSFEITIRWYLSFCRRARAEITVQSARDFIECVRQEKQPPSWRLEHWKDALRWFFRSANQPPQPAPPAPASPQQEESPVWLPAQGANWPEWKVAFLTTLRRRHYSYRTEESYQVWIEQFARYLGTEDLRAQGEAQISAWAGGEPRNTEGSGLQFSEVPRLCGSNCRFYDDIPGLEGLRFLAPVRERLRKIHESWISADALHQ